MVSGKMISLAFDTTAASCSVILSEDKRILYKSENLMEFGQSEFLLPEIDKALRQNGIGFTAVDNLFVCVGPGSFTGVRSGISAARVFKLASEKLNIGGVSAFEAYKKTFAEEDIAELNAIIIETRRDDFYVQIFDKHLQPLSEPDAKPREEIITSLKGKLVSLSGDGVERFLSSPSGLCLHAIKMYDCLPAENLLSAGEEMLKEKKLNFPKPLYLRAAEVSMPKSR